MYRSPPAPPISIYPVTDATPQLLDVLIELFVSVFPEDERYADYIRESARRARVGDERAIVHQWLVECEGQFVGFRMFNYLRHHNVGFDRYVGMLPAWRGRGILRALQPLTLAQLRADATACRQPTPIGMCEELDHPDTAPDAEERTYREQRVAIYERLGACILDVDYLEPPAVRGMQANPHDLINVDAEPMLLALTPLQPIETLEPAQIAEIVVGILVDNYRLDVESSHVRQVLASIGRAQPRLASEFAPMLELCI